MTLLRAADVSLAFGARTLFQDLTFTIEEGERVGLLGVNGSGKSTLMRILAGAMKPDTGLLQLRRGARITYLPQEPEFPEDATVASELAVAQGSLRLARERHTELTAALEKAPAENQGKLLEQLSALSDEVERLGGWDTEHHARTLLDRLGVKDWDKPVAQLSGGLRKRVAIARALLTRPDLLMLDEPTNHLDADTVDWLEEELDALPGALLLVTHDRYFLDGLVERISEIEPGRGLTTYPGNYEAYLEQKLVAQEQAELAQHKRDRWISQEVAWLRRGPEARRTKSKARIQRARKLMEERGFVRPKVAALQSVAAPSSGHTVLEAKGIGKRFGERTVLEGVSFHLQRGERVGLLGPNGVGKTTFLRILLGELEPDTGTRMLGKSTKVAYYDQGRTQLDPEQTVYEAAWGEEFVDFGGKRIALRDYLEDLLFPVPMQRQQVKALSGGERNRLLLARLFLQGANLLVLDEPTNDLDIVTLAVLEGMLARFDGAVMLVTHDRYFLDKVATALLVFDEGKVTRYEGNFETYRRLKAQSDAAKAATAKAEARAAAAEPRREEAGPAPAAAAKKGGRLSYKDQREFDGMEEAISKAESEKSRLEAALASPETFKEGGSKKLVELNAELEKVSAEVERLYARWSELEALRG